MQQDETEELTASDQALIEEATRVRARAYAPYSRYQVGAALRAEDGRVFPGVNVENCAYPTCVCAEVNALTTAVAQGARRFTAIAVVTAPGPDGRPGSPCGNCRQALSEFGPGLKVILATPDGPVEVHRLSALLPAAFTPERL